jgi:protoporphyrinogen IX oxidase
MSLLFFKALHIIGAVAWFAAMFYLGRIFVYHKEALEKNDASTPILTAQYSLMEWRVYKIIMTPAMLITWIAGCTMLYLHGYEWFKLNLWMHFKLMFLLFLSAYHGMSKGMIRKLQGGELGVSSFQFRLFNEVPTVFLFLIVSLAVYRNYINPFTLMGAVMGFIAFLIFGVYIYKKIRTNGTKQQ